MWRHHSVTTQLPSSNNAASPPTKIAELDFSTSAADSSFSSISVPTIGLEGGTPSSLVTDFTVGAFSCKRTGSESGFVLNCCVNRRKISALLSSFPLDGAAITNSTRYVNSLPSTGEIDLILMRVIGTFTKSVSRWFTALNTVPLGGAVNTISMRKTMSGSRR